jgi:hypothetical protein
VHWGVLAPGSQTMSPLAPHDVAHCVWPFMRQHTCAGQSV